MSRKRNTKISTIIYVALNIGLAVGVLFAVLSFETVWVALVLTMISKWRVLAVRPRFWTANILANMVDIIVGVSQVILLYGAIGSLWLQIALTVAYVVWLLVIKPRSKRLYISLQAGIAVFYGVTALAFVAYDSHLIVFVAAMWAIGFIVARHLIMGYDDGLVTVLSLVWGFVFAELGWLGYHWLFAYTLPVASGAKLVQLAVIATALSFLASRVYDNHHRNGSVKTKELVLPIVFTISLVVLLVVFFNQVGVGSIL